MPRRVIRLENPPPIVANILVGIGVRLHEDQPRAAGSQHQLLSHAGAAILLLCCRNQQHVAVWQNLPQPGQIAVGRLRFLRRVRIGAINQYEVCQRRQIPMNYLHILRRNAQELWRHIGPADQHRPAGGGTRPADRHDLRSQQGVDQTTLAHAGPTQRCHHKGGIQPYPQRLGPLVKSTDQRLARPRRLPVRRIVCPTPQRFGQGVDFRQQFEMGQFRASHPSVHLLRTTGRNQASRSAGSIRPQGQPADRRSYPRHPRSSILRSYWVLHWNWNEADHREAERSGLGWTPCSVFNTGINKA